MQRQVRRCARLTRRHKRRITDAQRGTRTRTNVCRRVLHVLGEAVYMHQRQALHARLARARGELGVQCRATDTRRQRRVHTAVRVEKLERRRGQVDDKVVDQAAGARLWRGGRTGCCRLGDPSLLPRAEQLVAKGPAWICLLYTSDAADE